MIPKIFEHKIHTSRQKLLKKLQTLKNEGKTIVLTNGCFDLLHSGHVTYLNHAKELGNVLVVGVNDDESVRSLNKGTERPLNNLEERLIVLAALDSVDFLIPFSEHTPEQLIREIHPDIDVKGGDYKFETLPEKHVIEEIGARFVSIPIERERSTTALIRKIQETVSLKKMTTTRQVNMRKSNKLVMDVESKSIKSYFKLRGTKQEPEVVSFENQLEDKNILYFRSPGIGDLLMDTPALRAIKKVAPSSKITLLTSSAASQIAKFIPEIDNVIVFDTPWELVFSVQTSQKVMDIVKRIKDNKFDIGIISANYDQNPLTTATVMFMAGVPRRISFCHENPWQLLTDWIPDPEPYEYVRHSIIRSLNLVQVLGADVSNPKMSLVVSAKVKNQVRRILTKLRVDLRRKIIVCHAATNDFKRQYSPTGFTKVCKLLVDKGYQVIFTGLNSEKEFVEQIQSQLGIGSFSLAGKINIAQMLALLELSDILVANNTGPVHMAYGLGVPVVDLYARTNPQHIPWDVPSKVLYFDIPVPVDKSMDQVPPQMIVDAVEELVDAKSYSPYTHV